MDSAEPGDAYTKLNKTTPSKLLQKSYEAALMLNSQQKAPLSKIHESAREFRNSDLLHSSKHFEPSTPIIVEASQILEDSQS